MELPKTAYVILGMLGLGKSTGYDIKALVDVSTRFFWAASYGQIYPELKKLEAAGLIEGAEEPGDGRRRRVYRLTPAGESALRAWLNSSDELHTELRHEGVLKFFFADALGPDEQLALMRRIREHHEALAEQLREIQAVKDDEETDSRFPGLTLAWGIEYQERMAEWCSVTEQQLSEELARR